MNRLFYLPLFLTLAGCGAPTPATNDAPDLPPSLTPAADAAGAAAVGATPVAMTGEQKIAWYTAAKPIFERAEDAYRVVNAETVDMKSKTTLEIDNAFEKFIQTLIQCETDLKALNTPDEYVKARDGFQQGLTNGITGARQVEITFRMQKEITDQTLAEAKKLDNSLKPIQDAYLDAARITRDLQYAALRTPRS